MEYLSKKRDKFYYVIATDLSKMRDDKLSVIFDEDISKSFLGEYDKYSFKTTDEIYLARFWKDEPSARRSIDYFKKIYEQKGHKPIFDIQSLTQKEFINSIPDGLDIDNYVYKKNLKFKKIELEYNQDKDSFRKAYKAINAYVQVDKPWYWFNCPKCGSKPLVWEFNNGRSTACGCGENEYVHESVEAESVMSYVTRNNGSALGYDSDELRKNWNHWCKTGEKKFKKGDGKW